MIERINELRARAARVRECAQYADRGEDQRKELAFARQLENESLELAKQLEENLNAES